MMRLRLTLDVDYEPRGEASDTLKDLMARIVEDALNYGTLTDETGATVEFHTFTIEEVN